MDLGLKDRVALVSGASGGLGFAVAAELAREGCNVAIISRDEQRIRAAADQIRRDIGVAADRVLPLVCDVTDEAQIEEAVQRTVQQFGRLEILITNAGGPPSGLIGDFSADQWRAALELNLVSTVNLCRHAVPHLCEAVKGEDGLGRILMITSLSAKQPVASLYLSNAARAGVHGFAKSLAEELGPLGITVNTILPGYTRTGRLDNLSRAAQEKTGKTPDEVEAIWVNGAALKRIGSPDEFAAAATFLVSRRASFITGVALPVDGGAIKSLM
jgi:3-oxoacyl-[acyl-carrier protein] reductase